MFEVGTQSCFISYNLQRSSTYPVHDGINYGGIDFPTPVKQIDKLEAQNRNLAINVFGWEINCVIVHRISRKEPNIPRINLMLIESGEIQRYCYVKRESAFLFDRAINNKTFYCMMCLTRFTRADLLENHKKYCNGVNGRLTRIEALVKKIPGCERESESKQKSYTDKTERHEACGYSYMVVRSDGEVLGSKVYGVKTRLERF